MAFPHVDEAPESCGSISLPQQKFLQTANEMTWLGLVKYVPPADGSHSYSARVKAHSEFGAVIRKLHVRKRRVCVCV